MCGQFTRDCKSYTVIEFSKNKQVTLNKKNKIRGLTLQDVKTYYEVQSLRQCVTGTRLANTQWTRIESLEAHIHAQFMTKVTFLPSEQWKRMIFSVNSAESTGNQYGQNLC